MLWLKILLGIVFVLVLLIILFCLTRVGVRVAYDGTVMELEAKIGLLTLHVLPVKERAEKKKKSKKPKRKKKPKPEKVSADRPKEKPKKSLPQVKFEDIKDAVHTLWPPLKRALGRTRRSIRVDPLRLSLTLGGLDDPPAAAEQYGYLQTAVWTGMPVLEKLLDIRKPYIHTGVDFEASALAVEGEFGISIRIGTLLGFGLGIGFPALRWFLRFRETCKRRTELAAKEAARQASEDNQARPA